MFKFLVWHVLLLCVSCELFDHELGYRVEYAPKYHNYQPRDYHFSYAVSDPHTGDHKSQWEVKHQGVVRGGYSLLEPDGTTRIVEYIADHDGFRAVVKKLGAAIHPEPILTVGEPIVPEVAHFRTYDGQIYNYANAAPVFRHEHIAEVPVIQEAPLQEHGRPIDVVQHPIILEPARSFTEVHQGPSQLHHEVPITQHEVRVPEVPIVHHEVRVPEVPFVHHEVPIIQHEVRVPEVQQEVRIPEVPIVHHEVRVPEVQIPQHEIRPVLQGQYEKVAIPLTPQEIRIPEGHYESGPIKIAQDYYIQGQPYGTLEVPITQPEIRPELYGRLEAEHEIRPVGHHEIRVPQHEPLAQNYFQGQQYGKVEAVPLGQHEIRVPEVRHEVPLSQHYFQGQQYGKVESIPLPQHEIHEYRTVEGVPLGQHEIRVPEVRHEVPLAQHYNQGQGYGRIEAVPQHGNEIGQGHVPLVPVSPSYKTTIVYGLTGNPEDDSRYSREEEVPKYHASYSEKVPKVVPAPSKAHSDQKRESPAKEQFLIYLPK